MNRKEAKQVNIGSHVIHPATVPPFKPLRVMATATSHAGRPMARLEECGTRLLPLTEYGLPPRTWKYDRHAEQWTDDKGRVVSVETLRALMPQLDMLESA